jgi:nucleotide-binding universal stress UspA family protein
MAATADGCDGAGTCETRGGSVPTATPTSTETDTTRTPLPAEMPAALHDGASRGTIVCGVDDTPAAAAALDAAVELSARLELRLVVVTVADAFVDDDGQPIDSLSTTHAREGARRLLRRLVEEAGLPVDVECRHDVGTPADALARAAQEERADVLVIGAGRRRLLRPGAGVQLAVELGAACSCPVVVVPASPRRERAPAAHD